MVALFDVTADVVAETLTACVCLYWSNRIWNCSLRLLLIWHTPY